MNVTPQDAPGEQAADEALKAIVRELLVLEDDEAVLRSGKVVLSVPYGDIRNVELGTKVLPPTGVPLYKVWQLHKRFLTGRSMRQMVNFEFTDKGSVAGRHFYYVRVRQDNEMLAWSSPMFINYK